MITPVSLKDEANLLLHLQKVSQSIQDELLYFIELSENNTVEATHQTRKKLKLHRSFLKLVRPCSNSPELYNEANSTLRDWGRAFSDLRDAHVRDSLFELFKNEPVFKGFLNTIESLFRLNKIEVLSLSKKLIEENSIFSNLKESIRTDHSVSEYLSTMDRDRSCLLNGIILSFEKSYKAYYASYLHPTAGKLHEWRKRIKDLQYQFELIHRELPAEYSSIHSDINLLSELLGSDQDLNNLIIWMNEVSASIPESETKALISYLKSQRNRLKSQIEYTGKTLYRGDPDLFKKTLLNHTGL